MANVTSDTGTVGVPIVKKKVIPSQWLVSYYEEFEPIIFTDRGELNPDLMKLLDFSQKNKTKGFRREVVLGQYPFLCAVRPEEKVLYIGSRRLARELALLKLQDYVPVQFNQEIDRNFAFLKEHIEKMSTLSVAQFHSEIEWVTAKYDLPDYTKKGEWADVESETQVILKSLTKKVGDYSSSLFEKVSDYGLGLTAQFDLIRVHLLKFLALLPSLDHDRSGKEIKRILLETLRRLLSDNQKLVVNKQRKKKELPFYLVSVFKFIHFIAGFMPAALLAITVRYFVRKMAKRFIAGESIASSHMAIGQLRATKRNATLDQLGELVVSGKEADIYFEKVLQLIHGMKLHIQKGEKNQAGIYSSHVSIKVSALSHEFIPHAFESTYAKVLPRLRRILLEAQREEVFINIDAEHYKYRDLVFRIYRKVLLETPELKEYAQTGIVVQAYLRDAAGHLAEIQQLACDRGLRMPIRLVKGAYWDAETVEAEAHQYEAPEFLNKEESDIHFRQLCYVVLKNSQHLQLALASHNLQDHAFVEALRSKRFPHSPIIEHQCLHMTYEALSCGLAQMNWPTRNYMPIGNLLVGMAYLVRRIMENSSQVGILSIMRSHKKSTPFVLPWELLNRKKESGGLVFDSIHSHLKGDFTPVMPSRLYLKKELDSLKTEIDLFENKVLALQDQLFSNESTKINCSSRPELILGALAKATSEEAVKCVSHAEESLKQNWWGKQNLAMYRVSVLLKAADIMLLRRHQLASLIVFEAGKNLTEALGDVDEAIDFINYYCRNEMQIILNGEKITNRGVFAVIAPWNFPLAIPCGMTIAPLVAGNAVILKPAEQTPLIGQQFYELLIEAGVPKGILQIIHGDGEVVGAPLVEHPRLAGVVFTGSKVVGQWIYRASAGKVLDHYHHHLPIQKKVITEMGGKNAVIVTNNCEMDETVSGILYGAFGHAGQKCSAASRIIVHREVKENLVARLRDAVQDIKVGESLDPATFINPLISEADQRRVRKAIEEAKDEAIRSHGKIIIDRSFEKLPGYCVGPAIIEIPLAQARKKDSWAQKEIFGPVLHIIEYESIIEAVELFNSTEYALTGGIYSQSQDDIDFLLKFLRVGNLYVNRPNTGARVAIEPFGGFKLSGTGPKAGGGEYVEQFHFPLPLEETVDLKVNWISSSGQQLMLPRPSLISIAGRVSRFATFSTEFMLQYEILMGVVSEKEKSELAQFIDWVKTNLNDYLTGKHPNYCIPGQMSYNDKSLVKECGAFCMVSPKPSAKSIHYFMAAMALGTGISVVALTQEAYSTWKSILDLAWKCGFSKSNLDLVSLSSQELEKLFDEPAYSFIYAGHLHIYQNELYSKIISGNSLNLNMRSVLSQVDGVSMRPSTSILDQFVWTRSFAINTMRHGAPLELSL